MLIQHKRMNYTSSQPPVLLNHLKNIRAHVLKLLGFVISESHPVHPHLPQLPLPLQVGGMQRVVIEVLLSTCPGVEPLLCDSQQTLSRVDHRKQVFMIDLNRLCIHFIFTSSKENTET